MSAYEALAAVEARGVLNARHLRLLQALAPFAHYAELDGTVRHFASGFAPHVRDRMQDEFLTATEVFRLEIDRVLLENVERASDLSFGAKKY